MAKVGFAVPILPGKEDLAPVPANETVWDWTRT